MTKTGEPSKLAHVVKKVGSGWRLWVLVLVGLLAIYEVGFVCFIRSNVWWDIEYNQPRWFYAPLQYVFAPRMAIKLYPIGYARHPEDGGFVEAYYWIGRGEFRTDRFWPNGWLMSRSRGTFHGEVLDGDYYDEQGKQISKIRHGTGTSSFTSQKGVVEEDCENYRTLVLRILNSDHSPRDCLWQQYDGNELLRPLCLVCKGRRLPKPMYRQDAEQMDLSSLPLAVAGDMYAPGDPRSTWKLSDTNSPSAK